MHILFIGYSNVIKRKILPFVHQIPEITAIDIAKYKAQVEEDVNYSNFSARVFNNYEQSLEESKADIAYISVVNSAHEEWIEKALKRGMHVIVDKPSCLSYLKAQEMVALANEHNLSISEATVYPYHPQIEKTNEILQKRGLNPTHLTINFSFPPLDPENFRYKKELGGGALLDLGPYTVSPGRIFFHETPEEIYTIINSYSSKSELETSYSVLVKYSKGRSMIGNFGFNSEYLNRINILGEDFSFEINRVFTPPHDLENEIILKQKNKIETIRTAKSNCFINFIQEFVNSIKKEDFNKYKDILLKDALALDMLRTNAFKK